jgi:hypothetical protein
MDISNQQNLTILSLSHDIAAMMSHLDPFIKLDVECATRHLQNLETTPALVFLMQPQSGSVRTLASWERSRLVR